MFAEVFSGHEDAVWGSRSVGWGVGVALVMALGLCTACYRGGERDKDPPPGLPGGLCLAPDGSCQAGMCNRDENYCYDPGDPCHGFFCGGDERGVCFPDGNGQPSCQCAPGYSNDAFPLYCCPDPSLGLFDEFCQMAPGDDGPPSDSGDESTDSGGSTG